MKQGKLQLGISNFRDKESKPEGSEEIVARRIFFQRKKSPAGVGRITYQCIITLNLRRIALGKNGGILWVLFTNIHKNRDGLSE